MPDTIEPIPTTVAAAAPGPEAWPEPDLGLLEDGQPALPGFPAQGLPPFWHAWATDTAHTVGAPVEYVAQALLASVAGVCGAGAVTRLADGWEEPLILWLALVGGPSHGKSSALDAQRRALVAVEKTTARSGRDPIVIEAATPLSALLATGGRRVPGTLLWRDEPGAWLAALGCNGRREPVEVSGLFGRWSPLRTAQGPGSPALSIVGCLDPDRLGEAMRGSDDGRAARFLYAWPRPAPWRSLRERPALRESEVVNALQHIARIAGNPAQPLVLSLGEQALSIFDHHLGRLHDEPGACDGVEAAWLGKAGATIARLAAALGLLDWSVNANPASPPPGVLTADALHRACCLWDWFRSHALAVLARAFPSDDARLGRQVLAWIRTHRAAQVSREDVRRAALGQAVDAAQALTVIESLEKAGFLRRVAVAPGATGRPPLRWDVHPALIGGSPAETAQTPQPRPPPLAASG